MSEQTNNTKLTGPDNFFDDEFLANPYAYFARMREAGPVVPLRKVFGRQMLDFAPTK